MGEGEGGSNLQANFAQENLELKLKFKASLTVSHCHLIAMM